ncbi:MAG: alpha/beta hydrolase [Bacillota bacterium]
MENTPLTVVRLQEGKNGCSKFYCHQDQENSLVVIFPGENYTYERPLLYYARKAALYKGHDVLCLSYKRKITWRDMGKYTIDLQADACLDTIRKCLNKSYKNMYFISKSIGTELAGTISRRLGYEHVRNFFLTPTSEAIKYIVNSSCIVAVGTQDGIFTKVCIDRVKQHENVQLKLFKDAKHSLEVDHDLNESLKILQQVTNLYEEFLRG